MSDLTQKTLSLIDVNRKQELEYKRVRWLLSHFLAVLINEPINVLNDQIDDAVADIPRTKNYKPASPFNDHLQNMLEEDEDKGRNLSYSQVAGFQNWVFASLFVLFSIRRNIEEVEQAIMQSEVDPDNGRS